MQSGVAPVTYAFYEYRWGYGFPTMYGGYSPVFTSICKGRCTVSMEPGTYELALEKNGRIARTAATFVPEHARIHGTYVDHSGTRTTGAVIGVTGGVAGVVMMIASSHSHVDCDPSGVCVQHNSVSDGLFVGGIATLIGSLVVGTVLASVNDRAEIAITPLRVSSMPGYMGVVLDRGVTQGAALSLRF
jgi:hypothetical protein